MAALFDMGFNESITRRLATAIYAIIVIATSLVALLFVAYGIDWFTSYGPIVGIMAIIGAAMFWLLSLIVVRVSMEFVINQFKISEYLKEIRDAGRGMGR
jgi:hypothetical protein